MILWCKLLFIIFTSVLIEAEILIDDDGGYKNIIVGLSPHLPESKVESLLLQLEVLFKNTSVALRTASRGNVFFREVAFAIPRKYEKWISKREISNGASQFKNPDAYLTADDVFTNPYTVQHNGCGKPGLRIHIPSNFLGLTPEKGALSLVKQWSHYRYGVFDESGFSNDEIYPACYRIPGSETIKVSDCTNEEATYEFRKRNRMDYERFPTVCEPVPVEGKNNDIVSSLMTNIDFPKMSYFCDDESHPHNRNAPTKQNALCRQKSTWEVISKHSDFSARRKNPSSVKTTFKYIAQSDPRFIVAIDSSSKMDQNGRMDLVRNAFSYFMLYDLPNNSSVGLLDMILDMKDIKNIPKIMNIQTNDDAEQLIEAFPDANVSGDIDVHRVLQEILEGWKLDVTDIILITATDITGKWVDNIATMLKSRKIALHAMFFQRKLKQPALLEKVAKDSDGKFFYIAEAFPPGTSTSTLTLLYEAFRSVYESFSWMNRNHVLVDQKTFSNNCSPKCVLSFPSDRSMQSLQVLITGPEFFVGQAVPRNSIVLDNGEQRYVRWNKTFASKLKIPAYMFTIENPQTRQWNLTFERKAGHNKPIVVIVRAMNRNYDDIINMQSWISVTDNKIVETPDRPPVTIYSEIMKGNKPVADVDVVVHIHQASENKETFLELKDSGEGDPDITKNDGIFSRYLTGAESGYYSLTIIAEKKSSVFYQTSADAISKERNCCGSIIPTSLTYESGSFKRITTYQSFFVESQYAGVNYPPRRIADLRVHGIEILKNNIKCYVLKWTAPGGNYDTGKAIAYDIKVFNTPDDALNDFESSYVLDIRMLNIQGPLLEPKDAGTLQTALVELTNLTSGTYFIAMKATSYSKKISDVSNIVEILYTEPTPLPLYTDSVFSKIVPNTSPDDGSTGTSGDNATDGAKSSKWTLAIGITCGILLILILIGFLLFFNLERYKKAKKTNNAGLGHNTKKTESNDALCNGSGGGNISIISPVNSWGADSLISHYETLQKRKDTETNLVANGYPTTNNEQENKETDSLSIVSSKYSYDNKIDQNSSLYDPIYYHQVRSQEEINYPYNPGFTPFSPIYTSSLRRFDNNDILGNPYPPDNASVYSYTTGRNHFSRLKTDV